MKCIFKNKYLKHLDKFEIEAYDSTTGLPVPIEDCESCPDYTTECRESLSYSYGIDNTGTTFTWANAEYQLTLSDGSTVNWNQTTASSGGWTAQLTEWANNLQAAADAAGLIWFVEPRAVNNPNPSDISGNYGSTPTGLPGAPSVPIAEALVAGGMVARYLNIQICPGQPVPVSGTTISHDDSPTLGGSYDNGGRVGIPLTTAGAILGPLSRYKVCVTCGDADDIWYIFDKDIDGYREANAGEIPNCWEPCGTYTLADPPPDRDCEFFIDLACDNIGQNDPNNFVNQITRRATVCNGEQIGLEYFEEDPTDPSALVPYSLIGDFVDCTTGEIIPLPMVDGILTACDEDPISESYETDVRIVGAKNPLPVFITDDCCGTPLGYKLCYGGAEGSASYEIDDNETDGSFSIGGTGGDSIKWEVESPASAADGLADVTLAIQSCINSGETANITVTDSNGIVYTFPATSIIGTGNADGTGNWAFQGPGAPANGSGKISAATVTCGQESGRAFPVRNCKTELIEWFDDVTGVILTPEQVETLEECPLPETCETDTTQIVNCATETGTTDDSTAIAVGDQILSIIQVDCNNVALGSTIYHVNSGELISGGIATEQCDPAPQLEEVRECFIDTKGVQWVQISIIDPTDPSNPTVLYYDEDNQLGTPEGESSEWESCDDIIRTSECIKWRNKYLGIDNTGTSFSVDYEIEVRQGDEVVGTFLQTPSASNTTQLNQWIAGLQLLYPNALIEQRYAPSGGAGLPAPTVGLDFDQMAARYVQFTACDGDDLPTGLFILSQNGNPLATPLEMDTQVIFGEEVRGYICYACGAIPELYYSDGEKIPDSDVPPCYVTCSESFSEEATTQSISEVTICVNGVTAIEKTVVNSDGSESLSYRDETGAIATPTSFTYGECSCEVFDYYEIEGISDPLGLRNREWHDTAPASALISDPVVATPIGAAFRESHDFSLPTTTDNVQNNLALNDTNNTAVELDIQVKEGYIIVTKQTEARYSNASEGYWAVELGTCCGELELLNESGGFFSGRQMTFTLPVGIHKIRLWNIDSGGSNSSATFGYSLDGGLTWVNDDTPPNIILSQEKPLQVCKNGYLCNGQYFELDKTTPVIFNDLVSLCKLECTPASSGDGGASTGGNVTVDNFEDSCIENDLTLTVQSGTGNIPAGFKSVTINNITGTTTINGGFQLGTGRRVDSISFGTDRSNCTNELLPAYTLSGGSHQWIGHR